jgi:steroid delta-isomerase-like uncharacterized protein
MGSAELERLAKEGTAAWDNQDADAFVDLFADDFAWYDWTMQEPIRDKRAAREYFQSWGRAFPDMKTTRQELVVGDDAVASEIEWEATNSGPMSMGGMEMPPTNKRVMGRGAFIAKVRDGKIVEFRSYPDVAGMMMQLGMMPSM